MKKNICIHGHFYQPPRENPWTGEVDEEPSAAPFHDWNERIAKECYEANTEAKILNAKGDVVSRVNNFEHISFDIGPTLLSWMKRKAPAVYAKIVEADRASAEDHRGHGNAMAQVYNHMIMPLASRRDKLTQILWGIRDFEHHYKRKPEGMWLSETAVDRESLAMMAEQGIKFTVLAPHQARRYRHIGFASRWMHTHHEGINTRHPYRVILDQGRQFHVFFYDGPMSREIAFQGVLNSGDHFAQRLLHAFGQRDRDQLVSTATDGESFGHHHKFGEMALAYALKKIEAEKNAVVTNYAEFLDEFGSFWEVDIHEQSSWSCAHGVERWRSDCGCRISSQEGWNQRWRAVLREAFDFLKDIVDQVFEAELEPLLKDPWDARNDYVRILLDPSAEERTRFLEKHAKRRSLRIEEVQKIWDLLEAQKFAMFMYTSCGWFFDELSGIEPVQMMKFASRALEYARPFHEKDVEKYFLSILSHAKSNLPEMGTGRDVFERFVRPTVRV